MDYLKSLSDLLKSKKEIASSNFISLSLGEIADAWNRKVITEDSYPSPISVSGTIRETKRFVNQPNFVTDVVSALKKLEEKELIAIRGSISDISRLTSPEDKIYLEVKKKFDDYYKKTIKEDTITEKEKKRKEKITTLYLNNSGDLYRESKEKYCYSMGKGHDKYKIIQYILAMPSPYRYHLTKNIAVDLEKDENYIRKTIGKINNIIKGKLKIKENLIKGRKNSGYRINPKYKIIPKNE